MVSCGRSNFHSIGSSSLGVPAEFATELLLTLTIAEIRLADNPWAEARKLAPNTFRQRPEVELWNAAFHACGCQRFATILSHSPVPDDEQLIYQLLAESLSENEIIEAAAFHGTLGSFPKPQLLDQSAQQEQARLQSDPQKETIKNLFAIGQEYHKKFGIKFLAFAQGASAQELFATRF